MLKPILVANPYAQHLTFLDDRTRTRRDHVKYLTLIRTIALLHQYQREVKTAMHLGQAVPYIEVTLDDIAVANKLAHQVLGRSLDELSPQTRRLLLALDAMVADAVKAQAIERTELHFSRKQVRAFTGWSQTQLRVHLDRLVDLEYLAVHHGKQGQSYLYELLYDGQGQDGEPFLTGLIDVEALRTSAAAGYDGKFAGVGANFAGASRGENGAFAGTSRGGGGFTSPATGLTESAFSAKAAENAHRGSGEEALSRRSLGGRTLPRVAGAN